MRPLKTIHDLSRSETDTLIVGMSGIGKSWLVNQLAEQAPWNVVSIDDQIQSMCLTSACNKAAPDRPATHKLPTSQPVDSHHVQSETSLEALTKWLGMPGNPELGGLNFAEFQRRRRIHMAAEKLSLEVLIQQKRKKTPLLIDASGSFCDVVSESDTLFADLKARFCIVSLRESDAFIQILIKRQQDSPKPICYPSEFIANYWHAYLREHKISEREVSPKDFAASAYANLIPLRRTKYAEIAEQSDACIDAEEFQTERFAKDRHTRS